MIKILSVIGTRPEVIKLAPVIKELDRRHEFDSKVCATGQHRELLDQMLGLFGIRPDYDLSVMSHDQSPTKVTVAVLRRIAEELRKEEPDWVVLQGDTTTTMAGALGAFHHGCRIAHVEAGLRTFGGRDRWPEEVNRRVAGVVADLHFAPTEGSAENLYREGVSGERVYVTGNTVIDALTMVSALPFDPRGSVLATVPLEGKRVVLVTMHRRETSREALAEICAALVAIAERHENVQIVWPVHPNPNIQHLVTAQLAGIPNISLLPPLDYQAMIWLLLRCYFVITDSGGVQEEITALGKPVLIVREKTERPEGLAVGTAHLVGLDRQRVEESAGMLLRRPASNGDVADASTVYGDGNAARRIVDALYEHSRPSPTAARS